MPSYAVRTAQRTYSAIVERGCLEHAEKHIPAGAGRVFIVTTADVWSLHGARLLAGLGERDFELLFFPGGETNKRLSQVEALADGLLEFHADRSSLIIGFGGGIVTDLAGFLAAIYMRGIPVIQVPTTLLAQVDAAVGGKTGANLAGGKNLIGAFHQPLAVLVDPSVLDTLPEREYRAGLFEVIKHGIIADAGLFQMMRQERGAVLAHTPANVDRMIADSVRIKAGVVSADEKESNLRRILNFGHTFGHALEAETGYGRFLHGEAVAWGMQAAIELSSRMRVLNAREAADMSTCIDSYGPIPALDGIAPENLAARLASDKKTVHGRTHFIVAEGIGRVRVTADVPHELVLAAIEAALQTTAGARA